jgi:hypothetical protein
MSNCRRSRRLLPAQRKMGDSGGREPRGVITPLVCRGRPVGPLWPLRFMLRSQCDPLAPTLRADRHRKALELGVLQTKTTTQLLQITATL